MNMKEIALQRRSIRKFRPEPVPHTALLELVDIARLYPSGGNLQPLRFAVVTEPEQAARLFSELRWAMYLPDFTIGPDERPTAYIVLVRDDTVLHSCKYDVGAASTMLMLAAAERGIASCPIGNYRAERVAALLNLPDALKPELVIALGYPAQESHVVPMGDSVRYTEAAGGDILVPKRSLEEVLV